MSIAVQKKGTASVTHSTTTGHSIAAQRCAIGSFGSTDGVADSPTGSDGWGSPMRAAAAAAGAASARPRESVLFATFRTGHDIIIMGVMRFHVA